uniref:RNase H type-1 domain-containing protein n=1 Tax=Fagus sylvatica TaxID=28930 RepID=A0A2N9IX98_FAGSY
MVGPPPTGIIKFNVDAAIQASTATIAVVACDEAGNILKAWAKSTPSLDPAIAEASAIL